MGIRTVVVTGIITSGCVECTVRDGSDLGYEVVLAEDACATWTPEMQDAAVYAMREVYAKVYLTEEICARTAARSASATR
jgi:nicotinamidase-related amidase